MKSRLTLVGVVACVLVASCATKQPALPSPTEKLRLYFASADALQRSDFNLEALNTLKVILHQQLHVVGDDTFSKALSNESEDIQISVVNCMGFSDPSEYNRFPKTKHVLAAAPKI